MAADDLPDSPPPTPPVQVFRWAVAATAGVLLVLLVAYGVYLARDVLVLVLVALFVAVSLDPAVRWLVRRRVPRSWAVVIVVVALLALLGLFFWSVLPPVVEQGGRLFTDLPGDLRRLSEQSRAVREITDRYHLTQGLESAVANLPGLLAGGAVGFVQRFLGALASALTVLVLAIYFMADLPRLRRGFVRLVPRANRPRAAQAVNVVVDKVGGYMIGNLIISLFAGVSSFVCLFALGVPFALPLAVWVALTDLIPMIGASVGAAGCLIVTLATGDVTSMVVVLVFFVAYQQLENYLIAPRVLRNTVDLSSIAVLLAALTGAAVLGVVGALMAIPIAAAIKVLMTPVVEALNEPPAREPPAEPPVPIPTPRDEDSSKLEP
jgi:predicted PurR-regulated permease PerM